MKRHVDRWFSCRLSARQNGAPRGAEPRNSSPLSRLVHEGYPEAEQDTRHYGMQAYAQAS